MPVFLGFPCGSAGKESNCNTGDLGSTLGLALPPGEGKDYPLQHSGLENSVDCVVHGIAKSPTQLEQLSLSLSSTQSFPVNMEWYYQSLEYLYIVLSLI